MYVNVSLKDTVYAASVCAIQRDKPLSLWDWDSSRSDKHCLRSKREGLV